MREKEIIDAKKNSKGNIISVLFKGNKNFTSVKKVIKMAKKNKIENAHSVKGKNGEYIRTNPDKKKGNNLSEMAKD